MKITRLADVLGLKPHMSTYFAHAPAEYFKLLELRTHTHRPDEDGTYQFIHGFFTEKDQLKASFGILASKLSEDGILWISISKDTTEIDKKTIITIANQNSLTLDKETEFSEWLSYGFTIN